MQIDIKLFATLKEKAGTRHIAVEIDEPTTVADLREVVGATYPQLAELSAISVVAVNRQFSEQETAIEAGDEVAMFPPVSGG